MKEKEEKKKENEPGQRRPGMVTKDKKAELRVKIEKLLMKNGCSWEEVEEIAIGLLAGPIGKRIVANDEDKKAVYDDVLLKLEQRRIEWCTNNAAILAFAKLGHHIEEREKAAKDGRSNNNKNS